LESLGRLALLGALAGYLSAAPPPAAAVERPQQVGMVAVGITGGFQHWGLSDLEETLGDRAELFGQNGYELESGDFGVTYAYAAEFEIRLTELWFLRTQFEWTRLKWEDRDRQFIASLGASDRTPISVSYESRVETRPLLMGIGACAAKELRSIRVAVSGNALVAPIRLVDRVQVAVVESITETEVVSTGTGFGFEMDVAVDYLTDVQTTLYVEAFWRMGSTTVQLEDSVWESSALPGERTVDLDGIGIRLGFRWI
jgi:hypothetical protein